MKIAFKLLYWLSIGFIFSCIVLMILIKTLPLEFSDDRYGEYFESTFFFGIPIAILLTLSRLGFKSELSKTQLRLALLNTILIATGCFILFMFYGLVTFGSNMCVWSSGEMLYQNSIKSSEKIIKRYFGCGATDSSPATVGVFKVQQITPLFIYVTKIDTTTLDKRQWISVKDE